MSLVEVAAIGVVIGFLGGLLGKGGSAIATPLLHAIGIPAMIAVAAPLPATIPSTAVASYAYSRERMIEWRLVRWGVGFGVPGTIIGGLLTRWIDGDVLVRVTDVVLVALGGRLLFTARSSVEVRADQTDPGRGTLIGLSFAVGLIAGLLANSGGFLLAPLFVTVLRVPIKRALATSLALSCVLAAPGTVVHALLGHIDWTVVFVFAVASVPLSFIGARTALRTDAQRLERLYGAALVVLGAAFLVIG